MFTWRAAGITSEKEGITRRGRINHKARLFRAMLMTPPASCGILLRAARESSEWHATRRVVVAVLSSLFSSFFFLRDPRQHTSLTQLQEIKHSSSTFPPRLPGLNNGAGVRRATAVLGRVTRLRCKKEISRLGLFVPLEKYGAN